MTPGRDRRVNLTALALLGAVSGALAGLGAWVFLEALDIVTAWRVDHPWLIATLPLIGLVIGTVAHRLGGRANGGTALVVGEARDYTTGVPARLAPMALGGTLLGHLGGASVGREGTALQISGSLTDTAARAARLPAQTRQVLMRAALAGGFAAVFGVPFTGVVFAWEVSRTAGRARRRIALLSAAVPAAVVGHTVVVGLGHEHTARPAFDLSFGGSTPLRLAALAIALGVAARVFIATVARLRRIVGRRVPVAALRPALGGAVTVALALLLGIGSTGTDVLGLSLPLLDSAVGGTAPDAWIPWLKVLVTVIALGSGFIGGEVTPLFVIGATWGAVVGAAVGLPVGAAASLGMVTMFAAAAHVPLAGAVLAVELFGGPALLPAIAVTLVARAVAGRRGVYDTEAAS